MLTQLDLCSGVGAGFPLAGLQLGGFELIGLCERDDYCRDILSKRFNSCYIHTDVRDTKDLNSIRTVFGEIDLISASPPCQPFSEKGKRKGAAVQLLEDNARQLEIPWIGESHSSLCEESSTSTVFASINKEDQMVAQLDLTLAPGAKVRVLTGKFKGQTGTVSEHKPKSNYQKSRTCVQLARDIKWFKRQQLEEVKEETSPVEEVSPEVNPSSAKEEEPSTEEQLVTYTWLDPSSIELENGTQSRVETDAKAIERYASEMREERWDYQHSPPVIFDDGEKKRPGDGHHRIAAALLAEQQILCEVRKGTLIDAIRYSCASNQRPSLHRTNADKRQAVEMMFATLIEEFGSLEDIPRSKGGKQNGIDWSNRRIAEHVGVGKSTVHNIYMELRLTVQIGQFTEGERIEVIEADNLPEEAVVGELGTVHAKDKKQGLWVDWDSREASFIHPDFVQKTDKAKPEPPAVENGIPQQQQETAPELNGKGKASAPPTSVEQETQQQAASVGLNGKGKQVLPDVPRNEAPESISVSEEFSTTPPKPESAADLSADMKHITTTVVNNAKYFSREDLRVVIGVLVAEHGLDAIDEILDGLEKQKAS
ncbi:MAG: hypothetical protein F6J89_24710 [Symploca sp. SIO1C4]|uniref:KOW domain-containing protein n=1 Tax=Symploca sp. SIO1C4 TaxID=2607765 RepID=A0A6B3NND6_9CYAN|nr:hypothetical protein [Symploca sp. SIO1C4]